MIRKLIKFLPLPLWVVAFNLLDKFERINKNVKSFIKGAISMLVIVIIYLWLV